MIQRSTEDRQWNEWENDITQIFGNAPPSLIISRSQHADGVIKCISTPFAKAVQSDSSEFHAGLQECARTRVLFSYFARHSRAVPALYLVSRLNCRNSSNCRTSSQRSRAPPVARRRRWSTLPAGQTNEFDARRPEPWKFCSETFPLSRFPVTPHGKADRRSLIFRFILLNYKEANDGFGTFGKITLIRSSLITTRLRVWSGKH